MKQFADRVLAFALTLALLVSAMPTMAFASLLDNDPEYNREVLTALTELVGSEDEARRYYDVMERYGLLDEDGSMPERWSIEMEGRDLTLDELKAILAGDYNPNQYLWVDGVAVTLGDVKTMLEIEDYIAYIRTSYFSDGEWTQEQRRAYGSLVRQLLSEGITLRSAGPVGPGGVSHGARVSVAKTAQSGSSATYTASLTGAAAGQAVSFDWKAVSGSRPVSGSGTVTLTAGSDGTASGAFDVTLGSVSPEGDDPVRTVTDTVYYVDCFHIQNALFTGDTDTLALKGTAAGSVAEADWPAATSFDVAGTTLAATYNGFSYTPAELTELQTKAVSWNMIDQAAIQHGAFENIGPTNRGTQTDNEFKTGSYTAIEYVYYDINVYFDLEDYQYWSDDALNQQQVKLYERYGYKDGKTFLNESSGACSISPATVPHSIVFYGGKNVYWRAQGKDVYYMIYPLRIWSMNEGLVCELYTYANRSMPCSVRFTNTNPPAVQSVAIPSSGPYYPGEVVPIVVTFSEPVRPGATITANGVTLSAAESGLSNTMTFPYVVQEVDNATAINVTSVSAVDGNNNALTQSRTDVLPVTMTTPVKSHSFTGMSAAIGGTADAPTLDVTLTVSENEPLTAWMGSDLQNEGGVYVSQSVKASIDGGQTFTAFRTAVETVTGGTLSASIPLPMNTGDSAVPYTAELYVDGGLIVGRAASAELAPAVFLTAEDMTLSLSVKQSDGTDYVYADDSHTIYAQDDPVITASYTLAEKNYSFPEVTWSSSDPTVANIDQNGSITPTGKAGEARFRLTALNGGVEGRTAYRETADALTFGAGLTPFLTIPNNDLQAVSGQAATVYWSSNLCDKNGANETVFSVTVKRGAETVYSADVTGTAAAPAAGVTIPGDALSFQYGDGAVNVFSVEVSSAFGGRDYTAAASIRLESLPAKVNLTGLDSYYLLDTAGSVDVGWEITNFDQYSAADAAQLFKLLITRDDATVYETNDPGTGGADGHFTGSYVLGNLDVTAHAGDKNSYRDVYTVTIQAKNGSGGTWSYDSFLLYVYDADALNIWVDGADKSSLTMSNVSRISQMGQADILALKRDISLHNVISANYGDYAWSELADQLAWASSNNDVATVNYQQGTLYEDIRSFTYTSYRPATDFVLSGLSDGSATVTARHVLTGMTDSLSVDVETLTDKLYLFQCYPQIQTALTYRDSSGAEKTVISDATGAAAIYEENGICSDVYCRSADNGVTWLGTFYRDRLVSGERDSTKLELYPCNNLQLRRAAYAYLYLKNPDGTPFTGSVAFRGGVYVEGAYAETAKFALNSTASATLSGAEDQTVALGSDGKLEVVMDQTQWGLPGDQVHAGDAISYTFLLKQGGDATAYYPLLVELDATVNQNAYVENGDAVVTFRANSGTGKHPFIVGQTVTVRKPDTGYSSTSDVLDDTGRVGPTDSLPESDLTTVVMWWGDEPASNPKNRLQLFTGHGKKISPDTSVQSNGAYPFADELLTTYTVPLNESSLKGVVDRREIRGMYLEYYRDGQTLTRKEDLSLRLCNLMGAGKVEDSDTLAGQLQQMGAFTGTSGDGAKDMDLGDSFVNAAFSFIAKDTFSVGASDLFQLKLSPTSDPTKFMGFLSVSFGNMSAEKNVTGVYADGSASSKGIYTPGFKEICLLFSAGKEGALTKYGMKYMDEYNKVLKHKGKADPSFTFGGYLETLVYFDFASGKWKMQVIDGGFHAGGGVTYRQEWNYMVGPVPFNVELSIGGTAEVSMDAVTAAYIPQNSATGDAELDNEFLTQLRIYLYLKLFAGVGFDYSIVALKLGIFGQISLDMQFAWLNRPYLGNNDGTTLLATGAKNNENANLNGQHFKINGQIGLEFVVKFLFISYEQVLFSYSFDLLNTATGKWDHINELWEANQKSLRTAIETLLNDGSASVQNVGGGRQLLSLNLAPAVESRDYLADGGRVWGAAPARRGLLRAAAVTSAVSNLESNTYPYADPELSRDGQVMAYLTDQGSADVTDTRAAYAIRNGGSYTQGGVILDGGYGDSQLVIDGTSGFAVAAWTRQSVNIHKDAGAVLTGEDQMMMMNGTEVCAAVYDGSGWTATRLTDNSGADVAPVAAAGNDRAIVAWRSVAAGNAGSITDFDRKDTILYKIYDGSDWSDARTLYNGTSGTVKGIAAAMMTDGTAAVAYTLDTDSSDATYTDREIVYSVVDRQTNEVVRNVRTTNDDKLDENPQLAAVHFPADANGSQRFVLGWYTQEGEDAGSDICLLDFDAVGVTGQRLPESLRQVANDADVSISSNFRFTKNAAEIDELSLVWVERDRGEAQALDGSGSGAGSGQDAGQIKTEKDVLKGVKFYTYGQNGERIGFTGALRVAEMPDATLIDHFDAYAAGNTVTAAVLGTTYGKDGETDAKEGVTTGSDVVQYTVPKATSALYTATDSYADRIEVPLVSGDYDTVKLGANTQIQMNVYNGGIHPVTDLTITIGDTSTEYHGLNLLPGDTLQVWADYQVPADRVTDPVYTVTATFAEQSTRYAAGTVYLNYPDLQITDAEILEETEGSRTIQIKLNNRLDSALAGSGRRVRLSFWSDPTCETAIDGYGMASVTVSDEASLRMIDEGGYSVQISFDAAAYVKGSEAETKELPESGIPIYIMAEVIDGAGETVPEPVRSNNSASVTCENLKARTGQDVMLVSDFDAAGDTTTVTVNMQNTRLTQTATGNLIVTLLDEAGGIVEQKQSYTGQDTPNNNGLITLGGEAKARASFTFDKLGAAAQVAYTDLVLDGDNAALASLTFSNIPGVTLESFTEQPDGSYAASVTTGRLTSTAVIAVTESGLSKAAVKANGGEFAGSGNAISETVTLQPGRVNTITLTVTADSGAERSYVLTVRNDIEPKPNASGVSDSDSGSDSETTAVAVSSAEGSIRVTAGVANDTATVTAPTRAQLAEITDRAGATGSVTVDLSSLPENVTAVSLPVETVKAISAAMEADGAGLTVKLPGSAVTFDPTALTAIAEQAAGTHLRLNVKPVRAGSLNKAQSGALAGLDVRAVYDVYLTSGNRRITDFGGGSATISVPCGLTENQQPGGVVVWYVAEDGVKTQMPSRFVGGSAAFDVPHFSTYVLAYDAERAAACPLDGSCPLAAFADLDPTLWYHDGIHFCLERGVMNGVGVGAFEPDGVASRAMIVTMLWRLEGEPEVSAGNPFDDVENDQWYTDAVIWAAENRIVEGYGDGTFDPDGITTREQLAAILYRCAQSKGRRFTGAVTPLSAFPDALEVSPWADEAMRWCVHSGIINGKNGRLVPCGDASRAEAATMLMRYRTKLAG